MLPTLAYCWAMETPGRHIGKLTGDSVLKMLRSPGALFVSGLTCFERGSPYVMGTRNLQDYPVSTGHRIAKAGAASTIGLSRRIQPIRDSTYFRNRE
ncbi:hypothetical protein [Granulicella arctica]|uniref:Uncharacterized protein n=1 Tax=Granulicella arctica TaxID=940613 RepID=A0A7Y9PEZ4_9BACT|nr:hypothetical protein [Granulicella arctica]NYF78697.1 hypothetical protein [Granulicella arctica]